ncbi:ATPase [Pseudomonas sp. MAP12]|uniref:ATPase n=1 Tax=Geopseudomonas aromaticivorans TaxID=2849492 RepID=A0ABS6MRE0_9GAMM|nr:BCAM0308 family protein [Pseudomonas aromaticivorans]MBV2131376.1 ATPase [Pseudomonas aromaticivorans]
MDKHQQGHKDTLLQPQHHDRDKEHQHLAGTAHCTGCGAYFHAGRWSWQREAGSHPEDITCPACRRIAENDAAGNVILSGGFVQAHRDDLLHLIRNTEESESKEHPLERLIGISEEDNKVMVATTGTHLANRIGHALEAAYDGEVSYTYTENETHLDVNWQRG